MALHIQDLAYRSSMDDIESFSSHQADKLSWHKRPKKILQRTAETLEDGTTHDHWTWFPGGEISTTYNYIDRHVLNGNCHAIAICWDSPVTGLKEQYTYEQLMEEVETLAGVCKKKASRRGALF